MPKVDVIIPALNEEAALPRVLRDIPRPPVRRVVVADNGSTDSTSARALENGAELVHEPERGYGAACLKALAAHPARIAFHSTFRPPLWPDSTIARRGTEAAWAVTDTALPSPDDEMALFGDADAVAGLVVLDPEVTEGPYPPAETVVDTTAAGDSFNGAFLAAILAGQGTAPALARGHAMAGRVIGHPGAIMPADAPRD